MHLGMADCPVPFSGHCDLDSRWHHVWCIASIFFEVGISNLVSGCILGWPSVAHHFWVTVTSDLVFRIIVMEHFFHHYFS